MSTVKDQASPTSSSSSSSSPNPSSGSTPKRDTFGEFGEFGEFSEFLSKKPILVLDGGTGEELIRRNPVLDDREIWSAVAVVKEEHHATLVDVHKSYMRAGADIVTANNYGITPGVGFASGGEALEKHTRKAGELLYRARSEFDAERGRGGGRREGEGGSSAVKLAGSLPPLLESYSASKVMSHEEGVKVYRQIIRSLKPNVDLFIAETLSTSNEALQALEAVETEQGSGESRDSRAYPVLVSWTLDARGKLRSGETLGEAVSALEGKPGYKNIFGFAVNCCEPEAVEAAFKSVRESPNPWVSSKHKHRLGAYPNRLTPVPDDWEFAEATESQPIRSDLQVEDLKALARAWVNDYNVSILGGCCAIGPEYIVELRQIADECANRQ